MPFLLSVWESNAANPFTRNRYANRALALIAREGAQAATAVPHLIKRLTSYSQDETSYEEMAKALVKIGDPALPHLAKALDDPKQRDKHLQVLGVLQNFGPKARPVVPSLLRALMSSSEDICNKSAETFGYLRGGGTQEAVIELRKLLKVPDYKSGMPIVGASTTALMAVSGPLTAAADLYPGRTLKSHRHIVDALYYIGPEAKDAVPDLIALFAGDNQELRLVSVRAVGNIGKEAIPLLSQSLADSREIVRLSAVQALTRMAPGDSAAAVPAVQALASSESSQAVKDAIQVFLKAHQS
jgi:HEAT repeat protein